MHTLEAIAPSQDERESPGKPKKDAQSRKVSRSLADSNVRPQEAHQCSLLLPAQRGAIGK